MLGYTFDAMNFHSISLGQGQEIEAEKAMDIATKQGHWVFLQNIHLVVKWLPTLEKKIEASTESSHENYRLFLSADPPSTPEFHVLPQGVLESAIKITNEPPTGMQANLHKALGMSLDLWFSYLFSSRNYKFDFHTKQTTSMKTHSKCVRK